MNLGELRISMPLASFPLENNTNRGTTSRLNHTSTLLKLQGMTIVALVRLETSEQYW
jgi:hypothetical protein